MCVHVDVMHGGYMWVHVDVMWVGGVYAGTCRCGGGRACAF